jgi:IS5 family transposase
VIHDVVLAGRFVAFAIGADSREAHALVLAPTGAVAWLASYTNAPEHGGARAVVALSRGGRAAAPRRRARRRRQRRDGARRPQRPAVLAAQRRCPQRRPLIRRRDAGVDLDLDIRHDCLVS